MGKIRIEIDEIAAKFILTAILFQKESGIVFEDDTDDIDFKECYGFSRSDLKNSLEKLRAQLPLKKSMREEIFEGKYDEGEIQVVSIDDLNRQK